METLPPVNPFYEELSRWGMAELAWEKAISEINRTERTSEECAVFLDRVRNLAIEYSERLDAKLPIDQKLACLARKARALESCLRNLDLRIGDLIAQRLRSADVPVARRLTNEGSEVAEDIPSRSLSVLNIGPPRKG